jgi:hypothetical protein
VHECVYKPVLRRRKRPASNSCRFSTQPRRNSAMFSSALLKTVITAVMLSTLSSAAPAAVSAPEISQSASGIVTASIPSSAVVTASVSSSAIVSAPVSSSAAVSASVLSSGASKQPTSSSHSTASGTSSAAAASETVPYASDDPNYVLWNSSYSGTPQPIRGSLGATILGPQDNSLDKQNPDLLAPPSTDAGSV